MYKVFFSIILIFISYLYGWSENRINRFQQLIGEDLIHSNPTSLREDLQNLLNFVAERHTAKSNEYAEAVLWSAMILEQAGDNRQCQRLLDISDKLFKKFGTGSFCGRDTIHEIFRLDLLSLLENNGNRDFMSLRYSNKSLKLKKKYFGENSEQYLNGLLDLSKLYAQRLNYRKSTELHNDAFISYVSLLRNKFCSLSDLGRENYWETAIRYINKTLELADKNGRKFQLRSNPQLSSAAYNALLLSKGILLNTSIGFERFVESYGNPQAKELFRRKKDLLLLGATNNQLDSLDYAIMNVLNADGIEYDIPSLNITWKDVQYALSENDLAIEFYRTSSNSYGAILIKKNWEAPKLITLPVSVMYDGQEYSLDYALAKYNPSLQNTEEFGDFNKLISQSIWTNRILSYFPSKDQGNIYFSADGQLQLVGIEYFPCTVGNVEPISERYNIRRLSSTRVLTSTDCSTNIADCAALFGGLKYNMTAGTMSAEHNKYPKSRNIAPYGLSDRIGSDSEIQDLRMTLSEITQISQILDTDTISTKLYKGKEGIEEAVKALSGHSPAIIHIATHGFYIPKEYLSSDLNRYSWLLSSDSSYVDNPLKRTGLLMAGAHKAFVDKKPVKDVDDGILSAYEISQLDLGNSDLVVLSACETGLGDITSDGIAGLQRGLKKAGTNCVLMSLWKVDDEATFQLMVNFYRHWITEGMNKVNALYAAQNDIRNNSLHPEWVSPRFWAAFILLDGIR